MPNFPAVNDNVKLSEPIKLIYRSSLIEPSSLSVPSYTSWEIKGVIHTVFNLCDLSRVAEGGNSPGAGSASKLSTRAKKSPMTFQAETTPGSLLVYLMESVLIKIRSVKKSIVLAFSARETSNR